MTTTTVTNIKNSTNKPVMLPVGQTSGVLTIDISFPSEYIMVLNDTIATLAVCIGEVADQTPDAQIWSPGTYLSLPLIQKTQKLTVFWSSPSAIPNGENLVQFYFSNVTIPLQGGRIGQAAQSNSVNVENTVTTELAPNQQVEISSLPELPPGTNMIGEVEVTSLPPIPPGTNNIGEVGVSSLPSLPSGSNLIGIVQKEANTTDVLTVPSSAITATTTSADIDVSKLTELAIDVNLSVLSGTSPTYQLTVNRKGLDGVYYPLYTGSVESAIGTISISLGHPSNQSLGNNIQIVETITGTTPSITRSMSVIGK